MPYPDYSKLPKSTPKQQDKIHAPEKHSVLRLLRRKTDQGEDWFAEFRGANWILVFLTTAALLAFLLRPLVY